MLTMKSRYVAGLTIILVLQGVINAGLVTAKWHAGLHCMDIPGHRTPKVCVDAAMSPDDARKKIFGPNAALLCVVVSSAKSKPKTRAEAKAKWYWVEGYQCIDDQVHQGNRICNYGMPPDDARARGFDPGARCCVNPT